jgi:hypothetical protein
VVKADDLSLASTAKTEMTSVCEADGVIWAGGHDQLFFLHPITFQPYDTLVIPGVNITAVCSCCCGSAGCISSLLNPLELLNSVVLCWTSGSSRETVEDLWTH